MPWYLRASLQRPGSHVQAASANDSQAQALGPTFAKAIKVQPPLLADVLCTLLLHACGLQPRDPACRTPTIPRWPASRMQPS